MIPSPYVIAIIAALFLAQGIKYLLLILRGRQFDHVRQLYASGNMPSTHSASVVALLTIVGLRDGIGSGLFGLALLFTIIVMYDSVILRRSVGDQGEAVQQLIRDLRSRVVLPRAAKGHTPLELVVGGFLGLLIGIVVFSATN